MEILLTLALLVLFATLLIPGAGALLRNLDARAPEQVVAEQILAARERALDSGRTVEWRYDPPTRRFRLDGVWQEPLPAGMHLDLLPPEATATVLIGGQLVATDTLRRVRFFPDGTCDRFVVQLRPEGAAPRRLAVDPWTCALSPIPADTL